ncbi:MULTISPECIES: hypothetical protein [Listeria]|uniref:hypothetical protein n=1 Tax=Listeria TaxID=1637 RepID=UPI000B59282E|nr:MULTISPECIES: hypothetical protein [Listeria]
MKIIAKQTSFEQASRFVDIQKLVQQTKNPTENLFTRELQIIFLAFFCGFIALLPLKNSFVITSILITIILISLAFYFIIKSKNKSLSDFGWVIAKYMMVQTLSISLVLGMRIDGNKPFGEFYLLLAFCYLIIILVLCYFRCSYLVQNYLRKHGMDIKESKTSKIWNKGMFKLSIGLVVIIILGTQFYRLIKWWFIKDDKSLDKISIQNEWLGTFVILVIIGLLVVLLIVFSLLPILLFNAKVVVEGIMLKEYAEEFRNQSGLTENEWYGEK